MRLFVAIAIPEDVKADLVALKTEIPGATWVKRPALHLTLQFLGDGIDSIRLTPIRTALAAVKAEPFVVSLRGTGRFPPNARKPARVLWVGIDDQPALTALHRSVGQVLDKVGFPPEDRPFSAHITLARLKGETSSPIDDFLDQQRAFRAEPFRVNEFHLMSSVLTPQGPHYRAEASFALKGD